MTNEIKKTSNSILLNTHPFCDRCSYFEPKATKLFCDGQACLTIVSCECHEQCEHISEFIREELEENEKSK